MDKELELEAKAKYPVGNNSTLQQLDLRNAFIAGATTSSRVKKLENRVKELEDGIKWALNNPQSVFVFNELGKLLTNKNNQYDN